MDLKEVKSNQVLRHPWETVRRDFFIDKIKKRVLNSSKRFEIQDIGSGDAYFAKSLVDKLGENSYISCFDIEYDDSFLTNNSHPQVRYINEKDSKSYDLVLLMDVLEHIDDDKNFLEDLNLNLLKNDSNILITVPAWNFLYTKHDKRLGHVRRYSPASCKKMINNSGFEIIASGNLFYSLIIIRFLAKLKEMIFENKMVESEKFDGIKDLGNWNHGKYFTWFVTVGLKLDNLLWGCIGKLGINIPGLTFWALCRKNKKK